MSMEKLWKDKTKTKINNNKTPYSSESSCLHKEFQREQESGTERVVSCVSYLVFTSENEKRVTAINGRAGT